MARVFVVASDVGPSGAAEALATAVRAMPPGRHVFGGLDLDGGSPLGFRRLIPHGLDHRFWRDFRNQVRDFEPHVLHAVGRRALRIVLALLGRLPLAYSGHVGPLLFRPKLRSEPRTALAIVHSRAEKPVFGSSRSVLVRYGVEAAAPPDACEPDRRILLFGGTLDTASEPLQAAWAFDVLKYAATDLTMVFPADGPLREPVERLSRSLGFDDYRVRFEPPDELARLRSRRPLVWLTQPVGGAMPALRALADGCEVIALRTAELDEYCAGTATLVPAGDRIALAAATLERLNSPRSPSPKAAHPLAPMVEGFAAAYDTLAASG